MNNHYLHRRITVLFTVLICLILNINNGFAQIYTIGTGTTTTYQLPINNFYGYSYNQSIYPAANLTAQGMTAGMQITQIAWYINAANAVGTTNNNNWTIYLGNTSQNNIDILSNGFKLRTSSTDTNVSGNTYVYIAFAENPFVTSTGIMGTAR